MYSTYRYIALFLFGVGATIVGWFPTNPGYPSTLELYKNNGEMKIAPQNITSHDCQPTGCPPVASCSLKPSSLEGYYVGIQYVIPQTDTLTITVNISGSLPTLPTGTLTFDLEDTTAPPFSIIGETTQPIHNGVVVYSVSGLPVGDFGYNIGYSGDANYGSRCFLAGRGGISLFFNVISAPPAPAPPTPTPIVRVAPTATPSVIHPTPTPNQQTTPTPQNNSQPTPTEAVAIASPTTGNTNTSTPLQTTPQSKPNKPSSPSNSVLLVFIVLLSIASSAAGVILWRVRSK